MAESITISPLAPEQKSMQYELLRSEGLRHIERLASNVWTDYNISDPGITILEVLSYVITDLGYRISYPIPDILAQDPNAPQANIQNFYTARQILPMRPVTYTDYRKTMMDVEVHDPLDLDAPFAGVKNAWIERSPDNEIPVYINRVTDSLAYTPVDPNNPEKLDIRPLYNILLEFDRTEGLGDLNENTLDRRIKLYPCAPADPFAPIDPKLIGLSLKIEVEFPRWDEPGIAWADPFNIKSNMKNLVLDFTGLPSGYRVEGYGFNPDKTVWLSIMKGTDVVDTGCIKSQIQKVIYGVGSNITGTLLELYHKKITKILQVVDAVRAKLMNNRNLCEDFYKINALRIEQIAVCADIQVDTGININEVEAEMYYRIGKFLSPTVNFYTLEEMYAKGLRTEEIFEGPALDHGFIDTGELKKAERKKVIHVSDLIQIIMDIPGVLAVKHIQIANIPLDNDANIPSVSVKWCLQLAFDQNYVPRLTTELSSITWFKDSLPFRANDAEVETILTNLLNNERKQKLHDIPLDLPVPEGQYRDIENYVSVQDEFPLTYGIGPNGLPGNAPDLRKAQAKQLKGFLMFFDQILANYMAQLANVKDLFSMNGTTNTAGDFVIDKSYFTQSLVPYVTDANDLLVAPGSYPADLQTITEDPALFETRRNKFLDHLMARFCEQFTDYALLMYKMDGSKAPRELLVDKLRFLDSYPEISSGRFRAFNYESPCELWHIDNDSGLEKRVTMLTGIDERKPSTLVFQSNNIQIISPGPGSPYEYYIPDAFVATAQSNTSFANKSLALAAVEKLIINGINPDRYTVIEKGGSYYPAVVCGDGPLAHSVASYITEAAAVAALDSFRSALLPIMEDEYLNNPLSNRNNLSCPLDLYYQNLGATVDMVPDPPYYMFDFALYKYPFDFTVPPNIKLLTGSYTIYGNCKTEQNIISVDTATPYVTLDGKLDDYILPGDAITIAGSADNDNDYIVLSVNVNTISPGVYTTDIIVGGTLTDNLPLGIVKYNKQTLAEMTAIGQEATPDALFEISQRGQDAANYVFTDYDPLLPTPYHFNLVNRCNEVMATSEETDFNEALANAILSHNGILPPYNDIIDIYLSTGNNGSYSVNSTEQQGAEIKVTVNEPLNSLIADGVLQFDEENFVVDAAIPDSRMFVIDALLSRKLLPGDTFTIYDATPIDGNYTVEDIYDENGKAYIVVTQDIPSDLASGALLKYRKRLPIIRVEQNAPGLDAIYVKGGADDYALKQTADFIKATFFSHEGMHIVEHILLRPKVNENLMVSMYESGNFLQTGLSPNGSAIITKGQTVFSVDAPNNIFFITGNIVSELSPLTNLIISGSTDGVNDGTYKILTFGFNGTETGIKVFPTIPDASLLVNGAAFYEQTLTISATTATSITIGPFTSGYLTSTYNVKIIGSQNGRNNGTYTLVDINPSGTDAILELDSRLTLVQDKLLQVNLDADCDTCTYEDPYSFIASTILPAWQGRFTNNDFRAFFDRSLRLECPAHLVMNICWISHRQMKTFELAWKKWLLENARKTKNKQKLSDALNAVIKIMGELRSSYPKGTLHDCEVDDTLTNAIILNKTIIGTT